MLPRLERVSKLMAKAGRVLVDQLDLVAEEGTGLDVAAVAERGPLRARSRYAPRSRWRRS
ncbi:hypothetical protein [Nonomuraea sp. 10N515B]|uniref:hypothetical protein n=1 Tax=Nonomuraea sp. 10N515B TaxID=3457422 RepID=UPI003FCE3348